MIPFELDPRLTFETYIVGSGNRLTCAAARRVAESPGSSYNPLFVYSASGLGKTHLLMALAQHARKVNPKLQIAYDTLEHFIGELTGAIEAGTRDNFRNTVQEVDLLLLDDVQFVAGHRRMQEELIRVWDALAARGGQVVLASDRPPPEIDGLDNRLLTRFSGGLIVDIGAPDYETRVAIVRRKADERGQTLGAGVAEALGRISFSNIRELQGALNRLLAVQELEGRAVSAAEVAAMFGATAGGEGAGEFDAFLAVVSDTVGELVHESASVGEQALRDAAIRWQEQDYVTERLQAAIPTNPSLEEAQALLHAFEADVARLRELADEVARLEFEAPELRRPDIWRDPSRIADAERVLEDVRERTRPLPGPPPSAAFDTLGLPDGLLALRAARAAAEQPGERYNPLFLHEPGGEGKRALLAALAAELQRAHPGLVVAWLNGAEFAADLISALERNQVAVWRERFRRVGALVLDEVDALAGTERAQEELFHLFEALQRKGAQVAFGARVPPREMIGIEERLKTRLGSGLVVEVPEAEAGGAVRADEASVGAGADGASGATAPAASAAGSAAARPAAVAAGNAGDAATPSSPTAEPVESVPVRVQEIAASALEADDAAPDAQPAGTPGIDAFFLDPEKLAIEWPQLEVWLVEELD